MIKLQQLLTAQGFDSAMTEYHRLLSNKYNFPALTGNKPMHRMAELLGFKSAEPFLYELAVQGEHHLSTTVNLSRNKRNQLVDVYIEPEDYTLRVQFRDQPAFVIVSVEYDTLAPAIVEMTQPDNATVYFGQLAVKLTLEADGIGAVVFETKGDLYRPHIRFIRDEDDMLDEQFELFEDQGECEPNPSEKETLADMFETFMASENQKTLTLPNKAVIYKEDIYAVYTAPNKTRLFFESSDSLVDYFVHNNPEAPDMYSRNVGYREGDQVVIYNPANTSSFIDENEVADLVYEVPVHKTTATAILSTMSDHVEIDMDNMDDLMTEVRDFISDEINADMELMDKDNKKELVLRSKQLLNNHSTVAITPKNIQHAIENALHYASNNCNITLLRKIFKLTGSKNEITFTCVTEK